MACLSTNRIELIDLYFACSKLGAVLVPFNYRLPAAAIVEAAQQARVVPERWPLDAEPADDCEGTLQAVLAADNVLDNSSETCAGSYTASEDESENCG